MDEELQRTMAAAGRAQKPIDERQVLVLEQIATELVGMRADIRQLSMQLGQITHSMNRPR